MIRQSRKSNIRHASKFANVFWFTGDLTAIYDQGDFERSFKKIYLPELELKKENIGYTEGDILAFEIKNEHNKFNIQLHKRDDLPFSINKMPHHYMHQYLQVNVKHFAKYLRT